jgi:hypothetical protein
MPRWIPPESRTILQSIADDERRPAHEREAARRELANGETTATPTPRRRRRNANVPMSQADQDADIIAALTFRPSDGLTSSDRIEIEAGMDESTRAILAAFGSALLWLFNNNAAEIQILIDLHGRTQSDFVREKATETIRWIAAYSPIEAAKTQAWEFIQKLDQPD